MTTTEITAHALALGITREQYPELWDSECQTCGNVIHKPCGCWPDGSHTTYTCTLPDPLSDDPRACLWEPFYMRALGWPSMCVYTGIVNRVEYKVNDRMGATWQQTPTAALHAAWLVKGAKG